jgi:hypothetical protein
MNGRLLIRMRHFSISWWQTILTVMKEGLPLVQLGCDAPLPVSLYLLRAKLARFDKNQCVFQYDSFGGICVNLTWTWCWT